MMRSIVRRIPSQLRRKLNDQLSFHNINRSVYATQSKSDYKSLFDQDGCLLIRGALNHQEIENIKKWTTEIEQDAIMQKEMFEKGISTHIGRGLHHFEEDKETQKIRICRSERIIDFHNGFNDLLCSKNGKLTSIVSECFGEESVLYKEKINYKYPNCGSFKPHQDAPAYPDVTKSISVAISIDDSSEISGCLEIAKGRHKEGVIGQNKEGIICDDIVENVEKREKLKYEQINTNSGDILLFDGYAPHKSGMNLSNKPRRIIYATYNPKSEGDLRQQYYERKKQQMLDGKISLIFDFDGNVVSTLGK